MSSRKSLELEHAGSTPYAPHPTPYTLHPTPYTLQPAPLTCRVPSQKSLELEHAPLWEDKSLAPEHAGSASEVITQMSDLEYPSAGWRDTVHRGAR